MMLQERTYQPPSWRGFKSELGFEKAVGTWEYHNIDRFACLNIQKQQALSPYYGLANGAASAPAPTQADYAIFQFTSTISSAEPEIMRSMRQRYVMLLRGILSEQHLEWRPPASDFVWFRLAHSTTGPLSLADLGLIVDGITSALNNASFDLIDSAFKSAILHKMSLDAIVAFCRIPFLARKELTHWSTFVASAKSEISNRQLNVRDVLRGL